jgi:hypothetical protein
MEFELRFLIICVVVIISVILMILFQRNAVPAFIAIWLLTPKLGTNLFGVNGIPLFSFVELACSLVLLVIALKKNRHSITRRIGVHSTSYFMSLESAVILFFLIMIILQFFFSAVIFFGAVDLHIEIPTGKIFNSFVRDISSIIFMYACYKLIITTKQMENCLKIFMLATTIVVVELLAVNWIEPLTNIIGNYSFSESQLFNSIFINDYNLVGLIGSFSGLSALYFYRKDNKWIWILFFLLSVILVIYNFKRSIILAFFLGVIVFLYIGYFKTWPIWKRSVTLFIMVGILLIIDSSTLNLQETNLIQYIDRDYIYNRILNFDSGDSIYTRLGIQLRAFEVIGSVFPLGVGGNMLRFYMGGDSPSIFEISDPLLLEGYLRVTAGGVVTEVHNGYIEHIASYGLMGFISILLLIGVIIYNLRKVKKKLCIQNNLYTFEASIIVSTGVFYLFLAYPKFYIVIFLMLHLSFLLAREKTRPREACYIENLKNKRKHVEIYYE